MGQLMSYNYCRRPIGHFLHALAMHNWRDEYYITFQWDIRMAHLNQGLELPENKLSNEWMTLRMIKVSYSDSDLLPQVCRALPFCFCSGHVVLCLLWFSFLLWMRQATAAARDIGHQRGETCPLLPQPRSAPAMHFNVIFPVEDVKCRVCLSKLAPTLTLRQGNDNWSCYNPAKEFWECVFLISPQPPVYIRKKHFPGNLRPHSGVDQYCCLAAKRE